VAFLIEKDLTILKLKRSMVNYFISTNL